MRDMTLSTPRRSQSDQANWKVLETRKRLDKCWSEDIDWTLYPETLKNVSAGNTNYCSVIICTSMLYYIYSKLFGCRDVHRLGRH